MRRGGAPSAGVVLNRNSGVLLPRQLRGGVDTDNADGFIRSLFSPAFPDLFGEMGASEPPCRSGHPISGSYGSSSAMLPGGIWKDCDRRTVRLKVWALSPG